MTIRDESNQMQTARKRFIYILSSDEGRFYVGRSVDLQKRIYNHLRGKSTTWVNNYMTNTYVYDVTEECNIFDEEVAVKMLMYSHGIHKVRGGPYSNIRLTLEQLCAIQRDLDNALGRCFKCGDKLSYTHRCSSLSDSECYFCKERGHRVESCTLALNLFKRKRAFR